MKMAESTNIKPTLCPSCGYMHDRSCAINTDGKQVDPTEGAWSICIQCAQISAFTADKSLRLLSPEERQEALQDWTVRRAILSIQIIKMKRRLSGADDGDTPRKPEGHS